MKNFIVLGSGCSKCVKTAELIEKLSKAQGADAEVSKETNPEVIMSYGVMSTPAIVLAGKLVHSGSMPTSSQIKEWLA